MTETFNGQDWATHTMSLLLENTYELYGEARELAQADPTGGALGTWVGEWFWGDLSGTALLESARGPIEGTRNGISRNDFLRIDWKDIAESLAAE